MRRRIWTRSFGERTQCIEEQYSVIAAVNDWSSELDYSNGVICLSIYIRVLHLALFSDVWSSCSLI